MLDIGLLSEPMFISELREHPKNTCKHVSSQNWKVRHSML